MSFSKSIGNAVSEMANEKVAKSIQNYASAFISKIVEVYEDDEKTEEKLLALWKELDSGVEITASTKGSSKKAPAKKIKTSKSDGSTCPTVKKNGDVCGAKIKDDGEFCGRHNKGKSEKKEKKTVKKKPAKKDESDEEKSEEEKELSDQEDSEEKEEKGIFGSDSKLVKLNGFNQHSDGTYIFDFPSKKIMGKEGTGGEIIPLTDSEKKKLITKGFKILEKTEDESDDDSSKKKDKKKKDSSPKDKKKDDKKKKDSSPKDKKKEEKKDVKKEEKKDDKKKDIKKEDDKKKDIKKEDDKKKDVKKEESKKDDKKKDDKKKDTKKEEKKDKKEESDLDLDDE